MHKLYAVWRGIKKRCYVVKDIGYSKHGALGIQIADEWLNDPIAFISWSINAGWKPGLLIDRVDTTKNYSPANCRFVARKDKNVSRTRPSNKGIGHWKNDSKEKRSAAAELACSTKSPEGQLPRS